MTLRYCPRCKEITSHTDIDFKKPKKNGVYIANFGSLVPTKTKCEQCKGSQRLAY